MRGRWCTESGHGAHQEIHLVVDPCLGLIAFPLMPAPVAGFGIRGYRCPVPRRPITEENLFDSVPARSRLKLILKIGGHKTYFKGALDHL